LLEAGEPLEMEFHAAGVSRPSRPGAEEVRRLGFGFRNFTNLPDPGSALCRGKTTGTYSPR